MRSSSGPICALLEPDPETIEEDAPIIMVVRACSGTNFPPFYGGGYLHKPGCGCWALESNGRFCDVGWFNEYVDNVGAGQILDGIEGEAELVRQRVKVVGHMECVEYNSHDGVDYDETFEIDSLEVIK